MSPKKKILYVVLDGLGDRPCPQLNNLTPLQAAKTPMLDELAWQGKTGLIDPVAEGIAPESDIAVISILGYEAEKYYTGRGPLEAYGAGIKMNEGDLAYRVNFATLGENNEIIDRRVGRNLTTEEAKSLAASINRNIKLRAIQATFEFKNTIGHRGVLVMHPKEGKLSGNVTNTDPSYEKVGVYSVAKSEFEDVLVECRPLDGFENNLYAKNSAILTNEFIEKSMSWLENDPINLAREKEGKLPANFILTRDGGDRLPNFPLLEKETGVKFACFVEMPVERGIALLTGMEVIELGEKTGKLKEDYTKEAELTIEVLKEYQGLYVHIKGPDEPAHDGEAIKKMEIIEKIDEYFFKNIKSELDLKSVIIAVTADHSTPCSLKAHSDDPVPLLILAYNLSRDNVEKFSEIDCSRGELGRIKGRELMPILVSLL